MTVPGFFAPITSPQTTSFTQYRTLRPPRPPHPPGQASPNPSTAVALSVRPLSAAPTLIITRPTPPPSSSSPPPYPTSSPPKYAPVPLSTERALLLAPPPSFYESGYCPHCLEQSTPCPHCSPRREGVDWVVKLLVILNVVVWTAVIWGYIHKWDDPDMSHPGCVGMGIGYGYYPGCEGDSTPSCFDC